MIMTRDFMSKWPHSSVRPYTTMPSAARSAIPVQACARCGANNKSVTNDTATARLAIQHVLDACILVRVLPSGASKPAAMNAGGAGERPPAERGL
jgi:hypothetical protein